MPEPPKDDRGNRARRDKRDLDEFDNDQQEHPYGSDDSRFDGNYPASNRPPRDLRFHRRIGPTQRYDDPT